MSVTFTPSKSVPEGGNIVAGAGCIFLVGTLTFAGSYATGGDTFPTGKDLEALLKQVGAGRVLAILTDVRGNNPEWNPTTKKLQFWTGAGVEMSAGAYPAALTAAPCPVVIMGR